MYKCRLDRQVHYPLLKLTRYPISSDNFRRSELNLGGRQQFWSLYENFLQPGSHEGLTDISDMKSFIKIVKTNEKVTKICRAKKNREVLDFSKKSSFRWRKQLLKGLCLVKSCPLKGQKSLGPFLRNVPLQCSWWKNLKVPQTNKPSNKSKKGI